MYKLDAFGGVFCDEFVGMGDGMRFIPASIPGSLPGRTCCCLEIGAPLLKTDVRKRGPLSLVAILGGDTS